MPIMQCLCYGGRRGGNGGRGCRKNTIKVWGLEWIGFRVKKWYFINKLVLGQVLNAFEKFEISELAM